MKNNVTKIKKEKQTQCFSYEVVMLVHIIADTDNLILLETRLKKVDG